MAEKINVAIDPETEVVCNKDEIAELFRRLEDTTTNYNAAKEAVAAHKATERIVYYNVKQLQQLLPPDMTGLNLVAISKMFNNLQKNPDSLKGIQELAQFVIDYEKRNPVIKKG